MDIKKNHAVIILRHLYGSLNVSNVLKKCVFRTELIKKHLSETIFSSC